MNDISFCKDGYRQLISSMLSAGYGTHDFKSFLPAKGAMLLRHDIDISLDHAVLQSQINNELGVSATFFFLVTSDQYNLANKAGRATLRHVRNAGQSIGLHFDAALYENAAGSLEEFAEKEVRILEVLSEGPVEAVSFHRPVPSLQGLKGTFASLPHAYEPRFFSEIEYCSDSQGMFRFGLPWERDGFRERAPFQLLTHPIWWMRDVAVLPLDALITFRSDQANLLGQDLALNCAPFREYWEAEIDHAK